MPEQLKTTTAGFKKVQKRKRGKKESLLFKRGKEEKGARRHLISSMMPACAVSSIMKGYPLSK